MTVSSTTTKNSYSGNASTTTFAYGFKIFANTDLTVILRAATGVETVQTLTTHYTVTNVGVDSGGNVVFGSAPASGVTVVIRRNMALTQSTDYVANDPFPAATHEDALDRLTFISQQMQEEMNRSIKLSRTNTMTSTEFTTSAADRASKILAFDTSGELAVTQELGTYKGTSATTTTAAFVERDIVKGSTTAQLNNIYICVGASAIGDLLTDTDHFALIVDAVSAAASEVAAEAAQAAAEAAQSAAETAETNAETAETNAAATLTTFTRQYHGASGSNPTANLDAGDLYFKTDGSGMKVYNGSAWEDVSPTDAEQTNINTVAGLSTEVAALGASAVITDMGLLATDAVIADMAQLANSTIIDDLAILATTDIVTDLAILATSANVTAMGLLGTSANVTAQGLLGTSAVIEDMGLLGVAAVIEDMALLGVAGVIEDMGILGTSANVTAMSNVSGSIANVNTVATNIASVNNFADVYRIASSAPSASLTAGDLYFNTSTNVLNVYGASGWQNAGSSVNGTSQRYHYDIGSAVTSVTGSDASSNTLAYDAGYVDVYVNGVRMSTADVTVTSGDTVTFTEALASGDEVDIVAYGTFAVASLNADNLDSGTVPDARITGAYTGITNLTATGVGSFGSLDISGDIDVDGTTNLDVVDIDGAVDMASGLTVAGNIVINAGVVRGERGTASAPPFTFSDDLDTGMFNISNAHLGFAVGGSERMRLASNGYLGVGTTSPQGHVSASNGGAGGVELYADGSSGYIQAYNRSGGAWYPCALNSSILNIYIAGTQYIQLDASGIFNSIMASSGGATHHRIKNGGAIVGSITSNTGATFFNTSSDYRLKENVVTDWDATTRLKQLKPSRFNFIADADTTVDGFLAHEVSSIVPEAIHGTKDETEVISNVVLNADGTVKAQEVTEADWEKGKTSSKDIEGNAVDPIYASNTTWIATKTVPLMQAIDQSKLVPLLVKTIQELEARITALEGA